jgi:uncharacterized protein (TIGR00297 family)
MAQAEIGWESKFVLLLVLPMVAVEAVWQARDWAAASAPAAIWTISLSALLGLVTWKLRAATPWAAVAGAVITASLMFSTLAPPYNPLQTALSPVLAVSVLAFAATRAGRAQKQRLGTAERPEGRSAAQVTANLGVAAILSSPFARSSLAIGRWPTPSAFALVTAGLAALAEAAADTVSSEIGQVFAGRPRMITTLRRVQPGVDGAVSLAGTMAGLVAAALVAACGALALRGGVIMFTASGAGGVFGFLFDSLLGATLEQRGWLNNDAVNFLSTAAAAALALAVSALTY